MLHNIKKKWRKLNILRNGFSTIGDGTSPALEARTRSPICLHFFQPSIFYLSLFQMPSPLETPSPFADG